MIKFGFIKHRTKGQQVLMVLSQSHQAATWCLFTVCCLLLISPAGINTRPLSASIYLFTNLFFPILVCPSLPLPLRLAELEKKREAKQREREAREKEARRREKAEEKEKRRKEYNAQVAAAAAKEQQRKKNEEKKRRNGQAAAGGSKTPAQRLRWRSDWNIYI